MIGLIQRVSTAQVDVDGKTIGRIDQGLMALIGVEAADTPETADKLLHRMIGYRIFEDQAGKMNLSLEDVSGGLLLVPQFTLVANTSKGRRPSFSGGPSPQQGRELFNGLVERANSIYPKVECGEFGADMQVHLVNDGPVTFWLQVPAT